MANRLSDDELRKSLQEYGEDVGPITPTTRFLWEKKLKSLRRRNVLPSPDRHSINAFSSDDSEIDSAVSTRVRRKRTVSRNESSERLSFNRSRESNASPPDSEIFKKPSPVNVPVLGHRPNTPSARVLLHRNQLNKTRSLRSSGKPAAFDLETSDSEFDSDSSLRGNSTPRFHKPLPSPSTSTSDLLGVSLRKSSVNTSFGSQFQRKPFDSTWSLDNKPVYSFSPVHSKLKQDQEFRNNGFLGSPLSNGEFHEEKIQGSSTNYSHCVSWMLVIGAVLFFVVIGTLYMSEVQKSSQSANKNYSKFCGSMEEAKCRNLISTSRELHKLLTVVAGKYECDTTGLVKSRNLTVAEARLILHQELPDEITEEKHFNDVLEKSINLVVRNEEFGIKLHLPSGAKFDIEDQTTHLAASALEAKYAAKSLWCRFRLSLQWTTSRLLILCASNFLFEVKCKWPYLLLQANLQQLFESCKEHLTIGIVFVIVIFVMFLSYAVVCLWRRRKEAQEKLFYEMVEKAIDILQDPQDASSYQSEAGSFKAVVNVRDALIPSKERPAKLWLWDKVVAFIEENESRVSVEYKKINGEDFKVWRWNPTTSSEAEGGKQGKVWQGQAFNSLGKGKNASNSPTPCLKIRNMFDSEVEYGDDWQVNIKDAILEKCEGNDGVRHISVDAASNEGCVYMLCDSSESAGKAFNALHGWWFDGKLVTVKYIRYKRYLERYPEAEHCTEPLKPSNNMRLSLSTPFFSSALERS